MLRSLRGKIAFAYAAAGLLILFLVLAQYLALAGIENRVERSDIVAGLLQDSLEMRRFEKKFYADENPEDLAAARRHAAIALERLDRSAQSLTGMAVPAELHALGEALREYQAGLQAYPALSDAERALAVERIRQAGHAVSSQTKVLSQRDHQALTESVGRAHRWLIATASGVLLLILLGGWWLSRRILFPIASVEQQLRAISSGNRTQLEAPALDRELVSF
ncbi:MAG TPA: sensor histidine kinase, partial [Thioalkalivibrio sp.]|nr:sensor histidine kinase [Thioalkalivibrio sp.]